MTDMEDIEIIRVSAMRKEITELFHEHTHRESPTQGDLLQMSIFLSSYETYLQRNEIYVDLWKDYGWMDLLTHVRSKSMRLVRKFWRENAPQPGTEEYEDAVHTHLDDAYDLLNYVAFFIRAFRDGNKWGRN